MKFGDILGSISPGYGMLSGHGLGQYLPYMSPLFLMHHFGQQQDGDNSQQSAVLPSMSAQPPMMGGGTGMFGAPQPGMNDPMAMMRLLNGGYGR